MSVNALDLMRPNELCYISTIIKAAAATRDWNAVLGSRAAGKVQEVQCMRIKDKLFIAGNFDRIDEGELIKSYLASFGVSNRAEFESCMRYSHELLSMDSTLWIAVDKHKVTNDPGYTARKVAVDSHRMPKYSPQDNSVIQGFAEVKPIFLASPPTNEHVGAMMDLIATPKSTDLSRNQKLSWFLRHFLGVSEASGATKATGQPNAFTSSYAASGEINIVKSIKDVHAELVLLSFLTREVLANPVKFSGQTVYLGGSKNACLWCKAWIDNYRKWIKEWFNVKILLPSEYTSEIEAFKRPNGSGAGKRPMLDGMPYSGEFAKALFNGGGGGSCADLAALGDTPNKLLAWVE
ncbi:nucleic acid/nucleotide deaminase domain-containing protein [Pseudomonas cichorii]|uniref:nucleic acid/nucleotide deaminase domain-containing protein n=1 Tax=Pseudomonas cichorii TaxID=36746 RepID=UPI001C87B523|nr:nucleic acid/nucleotide deaminase domain-containing protein [Pseudomonas cichorii]MBX8484830.1 nucleic acid/nucleotide deaminase domain-containing protein [Pseudomonas cichorii]MBX8529302.1 nucleic acid/nucleotide deaminase domain-containing protein [Pseudomonas cichorii]MBX8574780.1 nucleic acid/nucleotide deaminase domain-containing protein [Pseudomonas cichorii]MBX8597690.1 nucleic acid/nucleotide deaminase domain-containing protein [Pseudomonas cichorii]MBX8618016.1 nucleic acid/nucleot